MAHIVRWRDLGAPGWFEKERARVALGKFVWFIAEHSGRIASCIADPNFQPQTRNLQNKLADPQDKSHNDQNSCQSGADGLGMGKMEQGQTRPGGFVLEGVRGYYSGNMSVFACAVRFGRLAVVGLPAKTPCKHLTGIACPMHLVIQAGQIGDPPHLPRFSHLLLLAVAHPDSEAVPPPCTRFASQVLLLLSGDSTVLTMSGVFSAELLGCCQADNPHLGISSN